MRNWKTTRFTKTIRLTTEHSDYVNTVRGKKSRAGKLEEIIDAHKKKKGKKEIVHSNYVEHSDYVGKNPNINAVMKVLYDINPMLNFANKTERGAVQRLIDKLGIDKVINTAKAATAVYGKPYAPTITTPLELERNLSKLVAFYKKQESNANILITDPNV